VAQTSQVTRMAPAAAGQIENLAGFRKVPGMAYDPRRWR
jgi:hypothetical protein